MTTLLVSGDTAPTINGVISDNETTLPLNLAGCTVYFQMRQVDDRRYTVNGLCTITDAATGAVSYTLGANDLNRDGDYQAQFQVTYSNTTRQTTLTPIPITVRRA